MIIPPEWVKLNGCALRRLAVVTLLDSPRISRTCFLKARSVKLLPFARSMIRMLGCLVQTLVHCVIWHLTHLLRSGSSSVATTLLVHLMQLGKLSMSSTPTILAFLMWEVLVSLMSSSSRSVSMTVPMSLISAILD